MLAVCRAAEQDSVSCGVFRIRDPYVLAEDGTYYLYESTLKPDGCGVSVRTSKDLETWSGTSPVLGLPPDIASTAVWAPEVHAYNDAYWLFVTLTFAADAAHSIQPMRQEGFEGGTLQPRGVWVLKSGSPLGPFKPVKKGSVTPPGWMCLDGTLWVENGEPWMVFCHEWCQTGNGRMMAAPMSRDLSRFTSEPVELFRAADAPGGGYVTDGPFLLRTKDGVLRMIWSNFVKDCGYSILQCASESGSIRGPWKSHTPLYTRDGGHGMLFRRFGDGRLTLALHQPNTVPDERLHLYPVDQTDSGLQIADNPVAFVDPFVGAAGTGHTFPGACVPFGLVQASPDTGTGEWKYAAGYQHGDRSIRRFSQTHLNGTGCGDLGDAAILPFTGGTLPTDFSSSFRKETEKASPGYYRVTLDDFGTDVEMTATEHAALYRLHYPKGARARLLLDPAWGLKTWITDAPSVVTAEVAFAENGLVTGRVIVRQWVERTCFFALRTDRPFTVSVRGVPTLPGEPATGYVLDFEPDENGLVGVTVALSAESSEGAVQNLRLETEGRDFDVVCKEAGTRWCDALAGAEVLEGTDEQKRNFYTALYHLYQQPNDLADAGKPPRYSTLSMWDVFRAACPWYALMKPDVIDGIVASCLRQYDEVGYLPVWQLWGKDNHCMIGNHSVPVLVDAYFAGQLKDPEKAYRAVKDSLTKDFPVRPKDDFAVLDHYGYYPFDIIKGESVSRTLECAYDDACAARFAAALGKTADAAFFMQRAENWRNVFDAQTGFMRGKDTKGRWREPFNPYALGHGADKANDFTEGNAFQYSWYVLHDVPGLIAAMGGKAAFAAKLDALFAAPESAEGMGDVADVSGLIGQYAHGNEPSHHVAYLYQYAGRPDRTAEVVREIFDRFYASKPDGLCGNDDCGQMSAWYVFSALGFYPVDPASGEYVLGAPQLPKVRLTLPNGKTFIVTAKNLSQANKYVRSVTLNGNPLSGFILKRTEILAGGELVFDMFDGR